MRFLFFAILVIVSNPLHAQDISGSYKRYSGMVGKKAEVIVDLFFADTLVYGHYYYNAAGAEISLNGSMKKFQLSLKEINGSSLTGFFDGKVAADFSTIEGPWTDASKSKSLPFTWSLFQPEGSAQVYSFSKTYHYVWQKNSSGEALGCTATYSYCYLPDIRENTAAKTINETLLNIDLEGDEKPVMLKALAEESMEDEFDSYTDSYQETFPDSIAVSNKKYMDGSPAVYNWDYQQTYSLIYNENSLLVFKILGYAYTGGAHGNSNCTYQIYNLQTGDIVSLQDVFKNAARKELTAIAEKQLRSDRKISDGVPLSDNGLFIKKLDLKDAFFVDHGGIGFTYDPYEIAPYADGFITVYLKWEQLTSLIDTDGPLGWALQ